MQFGFTTGASTKGDQGVTTATRTSGIDNWSVTVNTAAPASLDASFNLSANIPGSGNYTLTATCAPACNSLVSWWQASVAINLVSSDMDRGCPPVIADGVVLPAVVRMGSRRLDAQTGKEIWSKRRHFPPPNF
jgi:hypothetical protein